MIKISHKWELMNPYTLQTEILTVLVLCRKAVAVSLCVQWSCVEGAVGCIPAALLLGAWLAYALK